MSTRSAFLFSIWLEFTFVYAVSVSFLYNNIIWLEFTCVYAVSVPFLYMVRVYICLRGQLFLFSIWLEFPFIYMVTVYVW